MPPLKKELPTGSLLQRTKPMTPVVYVGTNEWAYDTTGKCFLQNVSISLIRGRSIQNDSPANQILSLISV